MTSMQLGNLAKFKTKSTFISLTVRVKDLKVLHGFGDEAVSVNVYQPVSISLHQKCQVLKRGPKPGPISSTTTPRHITCPNRVLLAPFAQFTLRCVSMRNAICILSALCETEPLCGTVWLHLRFLPAQPFAIWL